MDEAISKRVSEVSALVDGLRALGFYANNHGPEVVVKPFRGAPNGYYLLFGLRQTYFNDFKTPLKVITTDVTDILSCFAAFERIPDNHKLPVLEGKNVDENGEDGVWSDIDLIKCMFPPHFSVEDLVRITSEASLPCAPIENGVEIFKQNSSAVKIGKLTLNNKLWYLTIPDLGRMRVIDFELVGLIYGLERLSEYQAPGESLFDVLHRSFGARRV